MRWGTALHEDFLLPQGAARDVAEVVADLRAHGIDFEESWLDPFAEFRFPRIGVVGGSTAEGRPVELELRQAIEPWHVLGEEATGSGTARYVDSSVERIQVSVRGIDPRRHLVTCQGVPVPLTPTGRPTAGDGEHYAGVRYRAWQPWSALHPSIEVHAPLHFDVVDVASAVSLGGATYHVVHPGGRSYEHPPVNAHEAEARRAAGSSRAATPPGASTSRPCGRPDAAPPAPSTRTPSTCEERAGDGVPRLRRPGHPARAGWAPRAVRRGGGADGSLRAPWSASPRSRSRSPTTTCAASTTTSSGPSPTTG